MIRGVLILCAGILGLAVDAHAACDIAGKVAELSPGFAPVGYGNCEPGPTCTFRGPHEYIGKTPAAARSSEAALIVAAYNAAPPFFQAELCRLDHIYIDTDTKNPAKPSVWGMRERINSEPNNQPRIHIGIAKAVLTDLARQPRPYAAYENHLAGTLLAASPTTPARSLAALSYAAAPDPAKAPQPAAIAVLAILAHEMGHIVWWERDVGASDFPAISWTSKAVQHGFHEFGVENPQNPAQRPPVKADVQYDLRYLGPAKAAQDLQAIYSGEWASLFATVAADEDFVETYKLVVLTEPGGDPARQALTTLKVTIPGAAGADVLANLNNPATKLAQKAKWVRELVSK
ncbi:MAG TPA: hypothetical protein VHW66_09295 [Stellaceae bacterium]|nr:hypothetical protein [Stellaceae bacterium]